jgi:CO dehydrogenase maturation factor
VKIAIGGKGGVGKTTVCSVWARLFADEGHDVLAIDADPSLSLGAAFGLQADQRPVPLIELKELIAERTGAQKDALGAYFRMNPKVSDLPEEHWLTVHGVKLLVLGGITQAGSGCACPEGAFLKALLAHTMLQRNEFVLVDLAAGVEFMGRASVRGIDAFVVVVEPGSRSIETAQHIAAMARDLGIDSVGAIANKITEATQVDIIRAGLEGVPLLGSLEYSKSVQEADLRRASITDADPRLVQELDRAKQRLMDLVVRERVS